MKRLVLMLSLLLAAISSAQTTTRTVPIFRPPWSSTSGDVPEINIADFGASASSARSGIALADAEGGQLLVADTTYVVGSNITITSPVRFLRGGKLKPAAGVTITFAGDVIAGEYQIFDLSAGGGAMVRTRKGQQGYVEWWGAAGNGTTDDTTAWNYFGAWLNRDRGVGKAFHKYKVTSTVTIPGDIGSLDMGGGKEISNPPNRGLIWYGGNNDVVLELAGVNSSRFESIIISNRENSPRATGVVGIVMHQSTGTPGAVMSSLTGNYFGSINVNGCLRALQLGDYTNDGWHSPIYDNTFEHITTYDTAEVFTIDSDSSDGNTFLRIVRGGPAPWTSSDTTNNIIHLKRAGNSNNIIDAFIRGEGLNSDQPIVYIADGELNLGLLSVESSTPVLIVKTNTSIPHNGRGSMKWRVTAPDTVKTTGGRAMEIGYKTGIILENCQVGGDIYAAHADADIVAINTIFSGYDFTAYTITGVNTGTKQFTVSDPSQTLTLSAGYVIGVINSTGNNAEYTIQSVAGTTTKTLTVRETIPSAVVDGSVESHYGPWFVGTTGATFTALGVGVREDANAALKWWEREWHVRGTATAPDLPLNTRFSSRARPTGGIYTDTGALYLLIDGKGMLKFDGTNGAIVPVVAFGAVDLGSTSVKFAESHVTDSYHYGANYFTGVAFASLGTPANGTLRYCSDCTKATPCAGGGTGSFAKRLNGAWDCN